MKKISTLALFAFLAFAAISCGNTNTATEATTEPAADTTAVATTIAVDEFEMKAADLVDQEITVTGFCSHICSHGAMKLFFKGDSTTVKVEAGEIGPFAQECVNANVKVTGVVAESRIDEAYLQEWEAQIAAEVAEKHGDEGNGCETEKAARKEEGETPQQRVDNFRKKIAERKEKEGKEYLSFYHIVATSYEIQ